MIKKLTSTTLLFASALCATSLAHASEMFWTWGDISYYPSDLTGHGNQESFRITGGGNDTAVLETHPEHFSSLTPDLVAASYQNNLRSSASIHIDGEARSAITWHEYYSNNNRDTQFYEMHINLKDMQIKLPQLNYDNSKFVAGFAVDVVFKDRNIWHSSQMLEESRDENGNIEFKYKKEGVDLGNLLNDRGDINDYQGRNRLDDYSTNIALGPLLGWHDLPIPGIDSSQVSYTLSTYAKWYSPNGCYETECGQYLHASVADPFGVNGSGPRIAVVAVPEADTWAMMFAGLGALGFVARRRQRSAL